MTETETPEPADEQNLGQIGERLTAQIFGIQELIETEGMTCDRAEAQQRIVGTLIEWTTFMIGFTNAMAPKPVRVNRVTKRKRRK